MILYIDTNGINNLQPSVGLAWPGVSAPLDIAARRPRRPIWLRLARCKHFDRDPSWTTENNIEVSKWKSTSIAREWCFEFRCSGGNRLCINWKSSEEASSWVPQVLRITKSQSVAGEGQQAWPYFTSIQTRKSKATQWIIPDGAKHHSQRPLGRILLWQADTGESNPLGPARGFGSHRCASSCLNEP